MSLLKRFCQTPVMRRFGTVYHQTVDKRMRAWGLRYDDLTYESNESYVRVLRMLPPDVWEARMRRLNRAIDLSAKHQELPPKIQAAQQTWQNYAHDLVADLEVRQRERETYK